MTDNKTPQNIFDEGLKSIFAAAANLPEGEAKQALVIAATGMKDAFELQQTKTSELEKRVATDPLTGIPNRVGIMNDLESKLEDVNRYEGRDLAVVFIDLDGFKSLNDNCGHEVGDKALMETARRLSEAFRGGDTVGRLGGDEMVLLLPYGEDENLSEETVRNKVRETLQGLVYWNGNEPYPIGASIGIASFLKDAVLGKSAEDLSHDLLAESDRLMYKDKEGKQDRLAALRAEALELKPKGSSSSFDVK